MRPFLLAICTALLALPSFSQGTFVPLGSDAYIIAERLDIKYGKVIANLHTSDKPYQRSTLAHAAEKLSFNNLKYNRVMKNDLKYLADDNAEWLDTLKSRTPRPLWKFYREPASILHLTTKDFNIRINPVLNFHFGTEGKKTGSGTLLFRNTRGVELRGNIRRVVNFYFSIYENQTKAPEYVRHWTQKWDAIPGNGYWKEYKVTGFDYFDTRGYVNVNVLKYFNITFGHDKNFIGNGQRSLFLSDFSSPYLFLKLNTKIWRINYTNIFAQLVGQYGRAGDRNLPRKYAAFHHLNVNMTHWLDIGFFEGTIMNRSDHFELQYLNPIIFYRAIEQSIGSPDNALVGADFKINGFNHLQGYGQVILDEFNFAELKKKQKWWGNKWGMQLGLKYIDIIPNLDAQLEFNMVRPFTYSHNAKRSDGIANYTHYNQPLAHPLGANFYEMLLQLRYQPVKNLRLQLKYIYTSYGEDSLLANNVSTNFGQNIFASTYGRESVTNDAGETGDYGHKQGQGVAATQSYFSFLASYMAWHNVYVDLEVLYRNKNSEREEFDSKTFYFGVGVRMNIAYKTYEF